MSEEWKDIPGYEGLYQVSNLGRVRSLDRKYSKGKDRKIVLDAWGYPQVGLYKGSSGKTFHVHRLVLLAFIGPCPKGMETRHFPDPDRTNNRLDNLSWGTRLENAKDAKEQGRTVAGERMWSSKLTESEVRAIFHRAQSGKESKNAIAADYGIHPALVSNILNRKRWKHITLP